MHIDLFHILKVVLHFDTFKDFINFLLINKKCYEVLLMLHVNPWFIDKQSILSYATHFKPNTINCCGFHFENNEIPKEINFIKNIDILQEQCDPRNSYPSVKFDTLVPLEKITSFQTRTLVYNDDQFPTFFINNENRLKSLQTIETNMLLLYLLYCENLTLSFIPNKVRININDDYWDEKEFKQLIKYLSKNNTTSTIDVIVSSILFDKELIDLCKLSGVNLYFNNFITNDSKNKIVVNKGCLATTITNETNFPDNLSYVIEQSYLTECDMRGSMRSPNTLMHFDFPKCLKKLSMSFAQKIQSDFTYLDELELEHVTYVDFPLNIKVKKLSFKCCSVTFKNEILASDKQIQPKDNLLYAFPLLEEFTITGSSINSDVNLTLFITSNNLKSVQVEHSSSKSELNIKTTEGLIINNYQIVDSSNIW
ncbi:F-box domain-containing protein [Entamoeba marina]